MNKKDELSLARINGALISLSALVERIDNTIKKHNKRHRVNEHNLPMYTNTIKEIVEDLKHSYEKIKIKHLERITKKSE